MPSIRSNIKCNICCHVCIITDIESQFLPIDTAQSHFNRLFDMQFSMFNFCIAFRGTSPMTHIQNFKILSMHSVHEYSHDRMEMRCPCLWIWSHRFRRRRFYRNTMIRVHLVFHKIGAEYVRMIRQVLTSLRLNHIFCKKANHKLNLGLIANRKITQL